MLESAYARIIALSRSRYALAALAVISFTESFVLPIPPDLLLIPMVLADRSRAWLIAGVCTLFSLAGGVIGYLIGKGLFYELGQPILELYGYHQQFANFRTLYHQWGFWIVFAGGFTPVPYKVITIASGASELSWLVFVTASAVSRGGRFFLEALLLWYLGDPIRKFVERHLGWVTLGLSILALAGVLVMGYL